MRETNGRSWSLAVVGAMMAIAGLMMYYSLSSASPSEVATVNPLMLGTAHILSAVILLVGAFLCLAGLGLERTDEIEMETQQQALFQ